MICCRALRHRGLISDSSKLVRRLAMSSYVFDPPEVSSVPIVGRAERFPVNRIYCVGRNYAEHVKEMGGNPKADPPVFFTKPRDAIVPNNSEIPYALATTNLHYEVELVVALGKGGTNIPEDKAMDHIFGHAVGIDLTRRDLQAEAKEGGRPWDSAKAFDQSAPISNITAGSFLPPDAKIWLKIDGEERQRATLKEMIWSIPEMIAILSQQFHLKAGDLIFTGTPSGVGPVSIGSKIEAGMDGLETLKTCIIR